MRHIITTLLVLCVGVAAQEQPKPQDPACPVAISRVETPGEHIKITYKNVSDKDIQAVKFNLTTYDAADDAHSVPVAFTSREKKGIPPGKQIKDEWGLGYYEHLVFTSEQIWNGLGMTVSVQKVLFMDGTTWYDFAGKCFGADGVRLRRTKK